MTDKPNPGTSINFNAETINNAHAQVADGDIVNAEGGGIVNSDGGSIGSISQTFNDGATGGLTLLEILEGIAWQLDCKEWPQGTDEALTAAYQTPADMVQSAIEEAGTPTAADAPKDFKAQAKIWGNRFLALAPLGIVLAAKVGTAVVQTYAKSSPVAAGLGALFEGVQEVSEKPKENS